jgi:hypothetical protein
MTQSFPPGMIGVPTTQTIWTGAALAIFAAAQQMPRASAMRFSGHAHSSSIAYYARRRVPEQRDA